MIVSGRSRIHTNGVYTSSPRNDHVSIIKQMWWICNKSCEFMMSAKLFDIGITAARSAKVYQLVADMSASILIFLGD